MFKVMRIIVVCAALAPLLLLTTNMLDSEIVEVPSTTSQASKEVNIPISFAAIKKGLYDKLKNSLDGYIRTSDCASVGTAADTRPATKQYRCGELPYGKIISDKTKLMLNVNFPATEGDNYSFKGGHFPLYMSRYQNYGTINVNSLDTKSVVSYQISKNLSDNVFITQEPLNGSINTRLCVLLPGAKVFSEKETINGVIKKKLLFWTMKANVSIHVNLGKTSFDAAKACGDIKTTVTSGNKIVTKFVPGSTDIQLTGVESTGLKVSTDVNAGWFVELIFKVIDFFGPDIEKKIENAITAQTKQLISSKMPKLTSDDFKSGKWLEHYINFRYSYNLFNYNVAPNVEPGLVDLRQPLAAACLKQVSGSQLSKTQKRDAVVLCTNLSQLQAQLFVRHPSSASKSCYKHGVQLSKSDTALPWWGSQCFINTKVTMSYPLPFDSYYTCMMDKISTQSLQETSCQNELKAALDSQRPSSLGRGINRLLSYSNSFKNWDEAFVFANLFWGYKDDSLPAFMKNYTAPKPLTPSPQLPAISQSGKKLLKVLTYNIQGLPSAIVGNRDWQFEEIGTQLNERLQNGTAPDVVMFQEMVSRESENIIKYANYPYVYYGAPRKKEGQLRVGLLGGDVIISRHPIVEAEYIEFGSKCLGSDCTANKAWLVARIRVPGVPHLVEVINVHLQSEPGLLGMYSINDLMSTQNQQTDLLFNFFQSKGGFGKYPMVYAADFNFKPAMSSYQYFASKLDVKDAGNLCAKDSSCVIPSNTKPDHLWLPYVDHHFIRPSQFVAMKVVYAAKTFQEKINGVQLSDHKGLEMHYELSW